MWKRLIVKQCVQTLLCCLFMHGARPISIILYCGAHVDLSQVWCGDVSGFKYDQEANLTLCCSVSNTCYVQGVTQLASPLQAALILSGLQTSFEPCSEIP